MAVVDQIHPQQLPPRPCPDTRTLDWMAAWWQMTEDLPHHEVTVRAHECCQQILHPAWFDPKDPYKGRALKEQQTRESDRQVRTPLVYLNNQQNVAQTAPETHDVKWKPDEQANSDQIGAEPTLKRFGNSVRSVVKKYVREAHVQDVIESWVGDAHNFPMSVLKVHFERELQGEPLKQGVQADGQDNLARIRQLSEDIARGVISKDDGRTIELADLLAGLGQPGEIEVREGLVIENLDLRGVRFPRLPSLEAIYLSPWISHEEKMTKRRLRAVHPYKLKPDGTWEGIHPEDLESAVSYEGRRGDQISAIRNRAPSSPSHRLAATASANTKDEQTELLVREVWDRESGYVYVLVEGVPYPAAKWKPQRTPEQWYPFIFLVLNRVFGQVTGIADTELQGDTQARVHRKQTDEEVSRWKSLPRGVIDSTMMDANEAQKVIEFQPYCYTPMKLGGKGIETMMKTWEFKFDPMHFGRADDYADLQREASLPQQALGVTGQANFAKEVEVAAAGNSVSSGFKGARIRRALERFYDVCGQILLQEVDQDAALEIDSTVFWPTFYDDKQATAAYEQIQREVRAQVVHEVIRQLAPVNPVTGMTDPSRIDPQAIRRVTAEQSQPLIEERCVQQFGLPRPLSRKSLYKSVRVSVSVVLDGELDRQKRLMAFTKGLEVTALAMRATAEAGITADWRPILKTVARLSGSDEDLGDEMFSVDADAAAKMLVQALGEGGQLSPETVAMLQQVAQLVATQQAQTQPVAGGAPAPTAPQAPQGAP